MEPRPELTTMPDRIKRLPLDKRGYPVPWFVEWIDGQPEFRVMSREKFMLAIRDSRCWVCGDRLGVFKTFVVGPMCGINATTSEPPCHAECAEWSAQNCPFLTRPKMVRREDDFTEGLKQHSAGIALDRNPGVTLLWTTKGYRVFNDGHNRPLIQMGVPVRVAWLCEGRNATAAEVKASVDSGLPLLQQACEDEQSELRRMDARAELHRRHVALVAMYPYATGVIEDHG